jgi:hypothetical protein
MSSLREAANNLAEKMKYVDQMPERIHDALQILRVELAKEEVNEPDPSPIPHELTTEGAKEAGKLVDVFYQNLPPVPEGEEIVRHQFKQQLCGIYLEGVMKALAEARMSSMI